MQTHYKKFVQWILLNFSLATEVLSMVYLKKMFDTWIYVTSF